jgi:uncharacterized membrane protein SpoIIM required for sporulation
MKTKTHKILKISSIVVLVVAMFWFFLWTIPESGESTLNYEAMIKGEKQVYGFGCDSELVDQVDGLWCNNYPQLANLDNNPEYSQTEKMLTRSIQLHNSRLSYLTFGLSNTFWLFLILVVIMIVNLVYDLKSKK